MKRKRLTSIGEWLPSRFRFPLLQLVGFVILSGRKPAVPIDSDESLLLAPAREQTRIETYGTMVVTFVVSVLFMLEVGARLPGSAWRTLPAAIFMAIVAWHALIFLAGFAEVSLRKLGVIANRQPLDVTTGIDLFLVTAGAVWLAMQEPATRWGGVVWLALVALNLVAALVLTILRRRVDALEEEWRETLFEAQS